MSSGDEVEAARVGRRLLSSGYRWVVLRPGEHAHMLNVEHHWKMHYASSLYTVESTFDWTAPLSPKTECGMSTEGGELHITMMSANEQECCADCWKLALR